MRPTETPHVPTTPNTTKQWSTPTITTNRTTPRQASKGGTPNEANKAPKTQPHVTPLETPYQHPAYSDPTTNRAQTYAQSTSNPNPKDTDATPTTTPISHPHMAPPPHPSNHQPLMQQPHETQTTDATKRVRINANLNQQATASNFTNNTPLPAPPQNQQLPSKPPATPRQPTKPPPLARSHQVNQLSSQHHYHSTIQQTTLAVIDRISAKLLTEDIKQQYNLQKYQDDNYIYFQINKGLYSLVPAR
jgi:hypothetical protein